MAEPAYPLAFLEEDGEQSWPPQGKWTYEDYLRLPDDGRRYEVIRGHLYVSPAPTYDHQFAVWQLARLLGNLVIKKNLGVILLSPFDIRLPMRIGDPVQPDLAFVRAERAPRSGDSCFAGAPDLVIEVLSPRTRRYDRGVKFAAYRDAGVLELWFADPRTRKVEVFVLSADRTKYVEHETRSPGETVTSTVLPRLRLEVSALFPL